ncbi:malonate decarboxylase holo-[acyl-carrier-protein] synthase [Methylobacterium sp. WL9]|uniref:Phosphoribosyl-dephospho-CoA transferase n=1 Tax=Methylobacterium thuringiense TaxID=1003091 RepID=A0ABQ4TQD3_9HYPH|nr:malonate decarboxylase holo-[acyl-carrier-protein] synthase [Methylobacterium sp. WL9]TXN23139.1 malonate decarboxylase holo-[acyl-carrier-protein] synthase [Methylobacterium sp. WL9]GJE57583.1 Phosphoribosyl-dephospho-CoA transferase [Methylobacterium thuringiense]
MPDSLRRHDLFRIDPASWATHLRGRPDLEGVPHVETWAHKRRPLIVRRRNAGEDRLTVPLGLPLPPGDGKRRIGIVLRPDALEPCPAPSLADVADVAPPAWRSSIEALIAVGGRHGVVPRPFGALLWQAMTGLAYLTPASDLDLLWPLADKLPPCLLGEIADVAAKTPMRLDGELILPDGAGIHWRELFEAPEDGEVLVKYRDRLDMRPAAALRASIAA